MATIVNEAQSFAGREIDLSRLNDAERRVLRMLGEGHTAKSIANAVGSTAAAVNERLREARRKTGVGSSRELARLLKAQENRDDRIGVGSDRAPLASPAVTGAEPWRPQTGVFAMVGLFVIAVAGAAGLMSQAAPQSNEVEPLIGTPIMRGPDLSELHAKVRREPRDGAWATQMEAALRARTLQIPLVGKNGNVLRVTCSSTLCEIAGTLAGPKQKAEQEDQNSTFNRTVQALQVPPYRDEIEKLGLKFEGATFTSAKGDPDRLVFLIYGERASSLK